MRISTYTASKKMPYILAALLYIATSIIGPASMASAISTKQSAALGLPWYDPNFKACGAVAPAAGGPVQATKTQEENAKVVMGIAKTLNLGKDGARIGLMVALAESGLKNYASKKIPISQENPVWLAIPTPPARPIGNDFDSVGVFQQRVSMGWSTIPTNGKDPATVRELVYQLMNPAYAAEAFFGAPRGVAAPAPLSKKGLQHVDWRNMSPWLAAQKVQVSFDDSGSNYKVKMPQADSLLAQLWDTAPAIPLPVPFGVPSTPAPGSTAPASTTSATCPTATAANCEAPPTTIAAPGSPTTLSQVRQNVVCLAQKELALWKDGKMKPGHCPDNPDTCYFKYSEKTEENWCADFTSWIYWKANYPLKNPPNWRVANTVAQASIGQQNQKFHYHDAKGYIPKPGDIAFYLHSNGLHHVNIVTEVKDDVKGVRVTTIGGNQVYNEFTQSIVSSGPVASDIAGYISPD